MLNSSKLERHIENVRLDVYTQNIIVNGHKRSSMQLNSIALIHIAIMN